MTAVQTTNQFDPYLIAHTLQSRFLIRQFRYLPTQTSHTYSLKRQTRRPRMYWNVSNPLPDTVPRNTGPQPNTDPIHPDD